MSRVPSLEAFRGATAIRRAPAWALVGMLAAMVLGCGHLVIGAAGGPSREGSVSSVVRWAYFTTVPYFPVGTIQDSDLPNSFTDWSVDRPRW